MYTPPCTVYCRVHTTPYSRRASRAEKQCTVVCTVCVIPFFLLCQLCNTVP